MGAGVAPLGLGFCVCKLRVLQHSIVFPMRRCCGRIQNVYISPHMDARVVAQGNLDDAQP